METGGQADVATVYTAIEKKMKLEGVCLVIHFLQILVSAITSILQRVLINDLIQVFFYL